MRRSILFPLAALTALAACREAPEPIGVGPHPADASAPANPAIYRPVTQGMRDYVIVAPRPWGQSNEQVAPKAKP